MGAVSMTSGAFVYNWNGTNGLLPSLGDKLGFEMEGLVGGVGGAGAVGAFG